MRLSRQDIIIALTASGICIIAFWVGWAFASLH